MHFWGRRPGIRTGWASCCWAEAFIRVEAAALRRGEVESGEVCTGSEQIRSGVPRSFSTISYDTTRSGLVDEHVTEA